MRVALCNKYYFLNGGTEAYLFRVEEALGAAGHTAVPFCVDYAQNLPTPYARHFLPAPAGRDAAHFDKMRPGLSQYLTLAGRVTYSRADRRAFERVLVDERIDAAYLINTYNYISPSILDACAARGVPALMFVGDYHLVCANHALLRDGVPCTECLDRRSMLPGLLHRCVHGSLAASALRTAGMAMHRGLGLWDRVQYFVVPTRFMAEKLEASGIAPERIVFLPTPLEVPPRPGGDADDAPAEHILYVGRVSPEKGVDVLVQAYLRTRTTLPLVIAGGDFQGERARIEARIPAADKGRVRFVGHQDRAALAGLLRGALFTTAPSVCFDNAPVSVYESFVAARAVVGSRIGGIPEQVREGESGLLVPAGDVGALAAALQALADDPARARAMGRAGRRTVETEHTLERHIERLMALFESARAQLHGARPGAPRAPRDAAPRDAAPRDAVSPSPADGS